MELIKILALILLCVFAMCFLANHCSGVNLGETVKMAKKLLQMQNRTLNFVTQYHYGDDISNVEYKEKDNYVSSSFTLKKIIKNKIEIENNRLSDEIKIKQMIAAPITADKEDLINCCCDYDEPERQSKHDVLLNAFDEAIKKDGKRITIPMNQISNNNSSSVKGTVLVNSNEIYITFVATCSGTL